MLLFAAGLLGKQLLLLVAQGSGGVEVLGVDRGFLLAARPCDFFVEIARVGPDPPPPFDGCQPPVYRLDPGKGVIGQPGTPRASRGRALTYRALSVTGLRQLEHLL